MTILYTPGEPAGIGPDIFLQLLSQEQHRERLRPILTVADAELMRMRALDLGLDITVERIDTIDDFQPSGNAQHLTVLHHPLSEPVRCGELDEGNAAYVLACLDTAIDLCSDGRADAMVTGPVHKGVINRSGIAFSGHTEYLAQPSSSVPVMMLATETLRVVLATTHLPLRDVADSITQDSLVEKLSITHEFLKTRFGIAEPRIMVLGLNPHAGEDGHLGTEEIDTIIPALESLRQQGMDLQGPLPADTAFTGQRLQQADAWFAMYHDQGLPVLKYSGFGKAVNITMGLPFVRTSVDHGTALELAGTGKALTDSLQQAISSAMELSGTTL